MNAPLSKQHCFASSDEILSKITPLLKGVIKRHTGGILAFCPSHDDRKGSSLVVSVGREGQVLIHCFAGCSIHEITGAIGLSPADLFPPTDNPRYEKKKCNGFSAWFLLHALRTDLIRLQIIASDLNKIGALSSDDRRFISEVIARLNDGLSYLEGAQ
ncbi:MAG: hypothetical protein KF888_10795 [Nitrosomonas sp.]|nr:hypothetical protein [Nitrosomonas sp.]